MSKYNTQTPYIASYVLVEKDGKYAFILRSNTSWMNGHYSLPAGKVEKNETFTAAAVREAKEEVGVDIKSENLKVVMVSHRSEANDDLSWVDVYFMATSWSGEPHNAEPHMHSEFAWFSLEDLPENTIPSQKYILEQLLASKHYAEYWY